MDLTCSICAKDFPATDHFWYRSQGRLRKQCKECMKARGRANFEANRETVLAENKESYKRHREKRLAGAKNYRERNAELVRQKRLDWWAANPDANRRHRLARYGLTPEDADRILAEQGNACAICREIPTAKHGFATDHCHVSGKFRAFLCPQCNTAIGLMKDDAARLRAAADYLER